MIRFKVGEKHPFTFELPQEGCLLGVDSAGLFMVAVMPQPTEKEITQFKALKGYAFYQCKSFDKGLIIPITKWF